MRGVSWSRNNRRWRASLQRRYLGEYVTFDEACAVRIQAEEETFGCAQSQATPIVVGDHAAVPVFDRRGQVVARALVDVSDLAVVGAHRWCRTRSGYPVARIGGVIVYLHRLLIPGDFIVDHRDRDLMNARRGNLRVCSQAENCRNTRRARNNRSGFKGASRTADGRSWRARIMRDRKEISLGQFATAEEAGRAYDMAAPRFHGEFASPNCGMAEPQVPA